MEGEKMMWNGFCPGLNVGAFGTWGWIWAGLYLLFWAGLIAGLVTLVVRAIRRGAPFVAASAAGGASGPEPASAVEIARLRYARGEIDRDTYLGLLEDLK